MKYYFDTNFLIYLISDKEELKNKCIEFLNEHQGEYYVSLITVLEAIYILQKNKKDNYINDLMDIIKEFIILSFAFEDILKAIEIKELNIFDALHYVLAQKANAKLVTFDKDFKGLENAIVLEY